MTRKIIHTSIARNNIDRVIIATCDDGTCWELTRAFTTDEWKQLPAIPQPETLSVVEPEDPEIVDRDSEFRPKTTFNIIVNGKTFTLVGMNAQLSYTFICKLANKRPLSLPTMTYSLKNDEGYLHIHKTVIASHGMIFNVGNTTNA